MSVSAGVTDAAIAVREKLRGKIGQTKVHRYWPGKAPQWAEREDEDDSEEEEKQVVQEVRKEEIRPPAREDDPRLRRLAESRKNRDEAVARHRQIRQAEIVSTREEEKVVGDKIAVDEAEEDEDAVEERRRRNRERILQRQREEEAAAAEEDEEDEEEEEEEDEYETDSEDEHGGIPMVKPVFVKKSERETIAERKRLEDEENAMLEEMKRKLELRKVETKQKLLEEIKKDEEQVKNKSEDGAEVDTDDETNEAEEYEAWKAREIARIKREREEKENAAKEKEEIEKLRKMSEEERKEWERKNPKEPTVVVKKKWKYMQKYYHKGAFFQWSTDEKVLGQGGTEVLKRDYSEATGDDKLNKSILPKVMQVKNFGRSGRTKWTHLVAEDTTQWDTAWTCNDVLRNKYNNKMAGMNKPIEKPHGSKKMKRSAEDLYSV